MSGSFESEVTESSYSIETEEDQASEDVSGGLIDNEAVEDNSHLEFEEDFLGEDSKEEENGEGSTDEEVGDSDSEADASDDDESEFGSFVVEDDKVVYASEDDGLDQLDQAAEMVSRKKRGMHYYGVLHECCYDAITFTEVYYYIACMTLDFWQFDHPYI